MQNRYDNMKDVVNSYKHQLNQTYPRHRFHRKHKKSDEIRKQFVDAQSECWQLSDELIQLNNKKHAINNARQKTKDNAKVSSDDIDQQELDLGDIKTHISAKEKRFNEEKAKYRPKASRIYQECQQLEQERLDLCTETLIKFLSAAHSQNYAFEESEIYDKFLKDISSQLDLHKKVEDNSEDESECESENESESESETEAGV